MVLELKEYTMASLGYKSLENPLISANQTRPSSFIYKPAASLLLSVFFFFVLPLPGGQWRRHRGGGAFLTISSTSFFLHNPSLPYLPNHPSALPSLFSFVSTFPSESGEGGLLQRRRVKRRRGLPFPFKLFSFVSSGCSSFLFVLFANPASFPVNSRWFWRIKGKDSIFLVHLELYFHFNVCSLISSVFLLIFIRSTYLRAISGEISGGRRRDCFLYSFLEPCEQFVHPSLL